MRIAITGGHGQLGLALQRAFPQDDVTPLSHADCDVTDESQVRAVLNDVKPHAVIHAAAWTDTTACETDPARAIEVNGRGSGHVATAAAALDAPIVYVSTNEVFDGEATEPYPEDAKTNPLNAYGRSKLDGEKKVAAATPRHQIVRTSWLYGPGRTSFPEKIVNAAREHGRLRLVTDEVASPTWTIDLAAAIGQLMQHENWGVFHLTNDRYASRKEWAEDILRLAKLGGIPTEPATQADFDLPYKKPVFTALANNRAAALGIAMRPWPLALVDHFRAVSSLAPRR